MITSPNSTRSSTQFCTDFLFQSLFRSDQSANEASFLIYVLIFPQVFRRCFSYVASIHLENAGDHAAFLRPARSSQAHPAPARSARFHQVAALKNPPSATKAFHICWHASPFTSWKMKLSARWRNEVKRHLYILSPCFRLVYLQVAAEYFCQYDWYKSVIDIFFGDMSGFFFSNTLYSGCKLIIRKNKQCYNSIQVTVSVVPLLFFSHFLNFFCDHFGQTARIFQKLLGQLDIYKHSDIRTF